MALHPDLQAFLELANAQASSRQRMSQMTAAQARAAYDNATLALDLPGDDLPTEDLDLPTRDGARIRARLYRAAPGHTAAPCLLFLHGGGYVLGADTRAVARGQIQVRSESNTPELKSPVNLEAGLLLEKKKPQPSPHELPR